MYYTYILRCEDNTLYTGITTDLNRRIEEHKSRGEKSAKYTRTHKVTGLEIAWKSENRVLASRLEYYIKKLPKQQKEQLIVTNDLEKIFGNKIEITVYSKI
ncbi:MAG: GIY-YIG nuclease family protein [Eubacterium sp.]|nr:GIY-YIG nuclease family protein [Eubacterium sp.]